MVDQPYSRTLFTTYLSMTGYSSSCFAKIFTIGVGKLCKTIGFIFGNHAILARRKRYWDRRLTCLYIYSLKCVTILMFLLFIFITLDNCLHHGKLCRSVFLRCLPSNGQSTPLFGGHKPPFGDHMHMAPFWAYIFSFGGYGTVFPATQDVKESTICMHPHDTLLMGV